MRIKTLGVIGSMFLFADNSLDLAPALVYMHKLKTDVAELNLMAFYEKFIWLGVTYHPDINDKFNTTPVSLSAGVVYRSLRIWSAALQRSSNALERLSTLCSVLLLRVHFNGHKQTFIQ